MRVLITGAQGFAGRYLATRWLDIDPEVEIVGCGRSPRNNEAFLHGVRVGSGIRPAPLPPPLLTLAAHPRYRYHATDVVDGKCFPAFMAEVRPEVIVHLASGLRDDPTEKLLRTNILGVENLFRAVATVNCPPPLVIVTSTGSVYGAVADEDLPIGEETPTAPFDMYSISKVAQEQVARMLGNRYEIPTMVVRIFNIVGPGQEERHFCGHLASQVVDIETGRRPPTVTIGPLTATRDFIDVRDVANGLIAVAIRGQSGTTYNLGSGREVAIQQVFDEMISLSRLPGSVDIAVKPGRAADMPRNVAAIDRIAACGFSLCFGLRQSLADVLDYYRSLHHGID